MMVTRFRPIESRFPGRLLVLLVLLSAGCSRSPTLYPVAGLVVFKEDRQPLQGGQVYFQSAVSPEVAASGRVDTSGRFTLGSVYGEGLPTGEYLVRVVPDIPDVPAGERLPPAEAQARIVAPRFFRFESSGLRTTVKREKNHLEIEIEKPSGSGG